MKKKNGCFVFNVPPYGYVRVNNDKTLSLRDYKGHWSKTLLKTPNDAIKLLKDVYHREVNFPFRIKDNRPMQVRILNYILYIEKERKRRLETKKSTYYRDDKLEEKTKVSKTYHDQIPDHIAKLLED